MRYDIYMCNILCTWTKSDDVDEERIDKNLDRMTDLLSDGYELYSAVPWSTSYAAGVRYILRKAREEGAMLNA